MLKKENGKSEEMLGLITSLNSIDLGNNIDLQKGKNCANAVVKLKIKTAT